MFERLSLPIETLDDGYPFPPPVGHHLSVEMRPGHSGKKGGKRTQWHMALWASLGLLLSPWSARGVLPFTRDHWISCEVRGTSGEGERVCTKHLTGFERPEEAAWSRLGEERVEVDPP